MEQLVLTVVIRNNEERETKKVLIVAALVALAELIRFVAASSE